MKLPNKRKRKIRKKKDLQRFKSSLLYSCIIAIVLSSAVLTAYGYSQVQKLGFFRIQHIKVSGLTKYSREKIISLSGVKKGASVFSADLVNGSQKLESDPWIYRSVIKKKLPDTIEIIIEEHDPIAVIKLDNYYLIDKNGIIFKKASKKEISLPKITGITKKDISKQNETGRMVDSALELIKIMQNKSMIKNDLTIVMNKTFGLTISNYRGSIKTSLGFDNFGDKLSLLQKINNDLTSKGLAAKSINIQSTEKAYITI